MTQPTSDAESEVATYRQHKRERHQLWRSAGVHTKPLGTSQLHINIPDELLARVERFLVSQGKKLGKSTLGVEAIREYLDRYDPENADTPQAPTRKETARERNFARAEADAENRVPVRITFEWEHDHIPWGMRQIMWDHGMRHRKNVWIGRLRPERAVSMGEEIKKFTGLLEITGPLGAQPTWKPQSNFQGQAEG